MDYLSKKEFGDGGHIDPYVRVPEMLSQGDG
jgi:hypothetical protein